MHSAQPHETAPVPPVADRRDVIHELHGDTRNDAYAWLRDTGDPDVVAYLTAERSYYDAATRHLRPQVRTLSEEMSARVPATDCSISYRRVGFVYYTETPAGSEYEQLCRGVYQDTDADDAAATGGRVLLDPADLVDESTHLDLGLTLVSPDERLLAYSVDTTGDEIYALRFRDLETGEDLPDVLPRTYYTGAWSADSGTFFYTVHDDKYRPHEVWRHRLDSSSEDDVLVQREDDERYTLEVRACRSGDVIEIVAAARDTNEVWLVDAHSPELPARCVEPRERGTEYRVEHARTPDGDRLFIVTNAGAQEYRLMCATLAQPARAHWTEVVPENSEERLYEVTAFAGHVVTTLRRRGRLMARSYAFSPDRGLVLPGVDIAAQVPVGTLELAPNEWFDAEEITVVEQSFTEPPAWYAVNLTTGARRLRKRQHAPNYDPAKYVSEVVYAPLTAEASARPQGAGSATAPSDSPADEAGSDADNAPSGTDEVLSGAGAGQSVGGPLDPQARGVPVGVPVTLVRRVDTPLDGSAPCLQYAYGAYEHSYDPAFDPALTCLLDRGVVYAHAHVRGGGEGGRRWWLDGRLGNKENTFTDHITVADFLAEGLVDGERIVSRGLSAGGLLQGAVFSQAPQRWRGIVAEVPFVDVVTTMLDASIPLTVNEWDEWGDPRRPEEYAWLKEYSPYDNLPPADSRPDLLVTGALHDPRVMVSEPAKWVAALRHTDAIWSPRCVFRVELGAGAHVGPSGRYAHLRYEAEVYAWTLERFGLV